jgi:hypothetical protein
MIRRFIVLVLSPFLAGAFLLAGAGPSAALPPYQPQCAELSISTTTPRVGAEITVSGQFFTPGVTLTIELHTKIYVLATVTVPADGTFSVKVKLPDGVTGNHLIVAVGDDISRCPVDPIQIFIGGHDKDDSGEGTSMTGVDVAMLLAVALGLLGLGAVLLRTGTRKRSTGL